MTTSQLGRLLRHGDQPAKATELGQTAPIVTVDPAVKAALQAPGQTMPLGVLVTTMAGSIGPAVLTLSV
jgi:hypothetical protein